MNCSYEGGGTQFTATVHHGGCFLKGAMKLYKAGEFGEKLSDQQLLRKDSAPCRQGMTVRSPKR